MLNLIMNEDGKYILWCIPRDETVLFDHAVDAKEALELKDEKGNSVYQEVTLKKQEYTVERVTNKASSVKKDEIAEMQKDQLKEQAEKEGKMSGTFTKSRTVRVTKKKDNKDGKINGSDDSRPTTSDSD